MVENLHRVRHPVNSNSSLALPATMTGAGVLLGTAASMSPEQAKGRDADRRSDVWAFGCVLFEMLSGRRAFDGDDVAEALVAVLSKEPDWSALPASVPSSVRTLLRRCLHRDRNLRLQAIGDARVELHEGAQSLEHGAGAVDQTAITFRDQRGATLAITIASLVVGVLVAAPSVWMLTPVATVPLARLSVTLPSGTRLPFTQ